MDSQLALFNLSPEEDAPKTVSALTAHIRQLFEADQAMQDVWVQGEVSNYKRAASGHLYFSLKDAGAQLKCVMWKTAAQRLNFEPAHGDQIIARGHISIYEPQGAYQLYADTLQPAGLGDLNRQFELLKQRLGAEGLFDAERKRPIPAFPQRIGIVTSPDAAGFQDILNILRRRYPLVDVILSPALVQGEAAPPRIITAIERLNQRDNIDVMIIARGGGSLEDLWCFNDEGVVRAVAASRIPTITGVGHEIDFTLVDFAADVRAPTPSAAAEVATPDGDALRYTVRELDDRMQSTLHEMIDDYRQALENEKRALRLLTPAHKIATMRQQLDDRAYRMEKAVRNHLRQQGQYLQNQADRLQAASPQSILQRGYAIVTRAADGKRMTHAIDAAPGTTINVQMQDGMLKASVKERELDE